MPKVTTVPKHTPWRSSAPIKETQRTATGPLLSATCRGAGQKFAADRWAPGSHPAPESPHTSGQRARRKRCIGSDQSSREVTNTSAKRFHFLSDRHDHTSHGRPAESSAARPYGSYSSRLGRPFPAPQDDPRPSRGHGRSAGLTRRRERELSAAGRATRPKQSSPRGAPSRRGAPDADTAPETGFKSRSRVTPGCSARGGAAARSQPLGAPRGRRRSPRPSSPARTDPAPISPRLGAARGARRSPAPPPARPRPARGTCRSHHCG